MGGAVGSMVSVGAIVAEVGLSRNSTRGGQGSLGYERGLAWWSSCCVVQRAKVLEICVYSGRTYPARAPSATGLSISSPPRLTSDKRHRQPYNDSEANVRSVVQYRDGVAGRPVAYRESARTVSASTACMSVHKWKLTFSNFTSVTSTVQGQNRGLNECDCIQAVILRDHSYLRPKQCHATIP
jgi:hypothetical protein